VEWDELVHMEPEARYVSFKYGNYSGSEWCSLAWVFINEFIDLSWIVIS
jgi:hypothetical protein